MENLFLHSSCITRFQVLDELLTINTVFVKILPLQRFLVDESYINYLVQLLHCLLNPMTPAIVQHSQCVISEKKPYTLLKNC